jgi:hypothetical protein
LSASLTLSLQRNRTEWVWAFQYAGQLSRRMAGGCGHRRELLAGRSSSLICRALGQKTELTETNDNFGPGVTLAANAPVANDLKRPSTDFFNKIGQEETHALR